VRFRRLSRVVLGQLKADGKSNEITTIPELLNLIDIKGKILTTDAMDARKISLKRSGIAKVTICSK